MILFRMVFPVHRMCFSVFEGFFRSIGCVFSVFEGIFWVHRMCFSVFEGIFSEEGVLMGFVEIGEGQCVVSTGAQSKAKILWCT